MFIEANSKEFYTNNAFDWYKRNQKMFLAITPMDNAHSIDSI